MHGMYIGKKKGNGMYKGKKISVAMASYNGEKFIHDQLVSICTQSVMPDEIIISDDGSKDNTLHIIQEVIDQYGSDSFKIHLLHNEGTHGVCKNFENALMHCTGDYVFLSDQDDIWMEDKVLRVIDAFCEIPDALCISHDADLIDSDGNLIEGKINTIVNGDILHLSSGQYCRLSRDEWLEVTVSLPLFNGMVMCISSALLKETFPFPNVSVHDQWLCFHAVKSNDFYFLNEKLTKYRLHENNTKGNRVFRGNALQKIKRNIHRFSNNTSNVLDFLPLGQSFLVELEKSHMTNTPAYRTAKRVEEIGNQLLEYETKGSISGAIELIHFFKTDMRYRRSGAGKFIYELAYILFNSKNKRIKVLEDADLF